jgi:hypothetical protein
MEKMKEQIRSVVLINPILSLKFHLEQEKEHKFFYKNLIRELTSAYQIEENELISMVYNTDTFIKLDFDIPVKIIHVLSGGKSYNQSKQYQHILNMTKITPYFIVPEKKQQLGKIIIKFFFNHEKVL